MPVIGFLSGTSAAGIPFATSAFRQGLRETGYVEGKNVAIEFRWADNRLDRLPGMAADLVHRQVSLIVAGGTPSALAAKTAATVITLLINPADTVLSDTQMREVLAAARAVGVELPVLKAESERDFDAAFLNLTQLRAEGLVVAVGGLFTTHAEQLAKLAIRHAMPAIYKGGEFAAAGGLLSYGSNLAESYRLTGHILKGDKPADLPVQQATKIELYINLKTAKALGINVPLPLSGRADELFE